jgi:hypothetical protein
MDNGVEGRQASLVHEGSIQSPQRLTIVKAAIVERVHSESSPGRRIAIPCRRQSGHGLIRLPGATSCRTAGSGGCNVFLGA